MNKKTQATMFSSKNLNEVTPQGLFDQLNNEFRFNLDVAADSKNTKCPRYYDEKKDALSREWIGVVWCNPPYGRGILKWVNHAASQRKTSTIVMLLPARTDTKWFQKCADTADEIRFIAGRLKFEGHKNAAPFPSMLVIWNIATRWALPNRTQEYNYNLVWQGWK